jgi:hypothetical protein
MAALPLILVIVVAVVVVVFERSDARMAFSITVWFAEFVGSITAPDASVNRVLTAEV